MGKGDGETGPFAFHALDGKPRAVLTDDPFHDHQSESVSGRLGRVERMEELGIQNVEKTILQDPNAYLVVRDVEDPGFLGDYFQEKYPGYTLVCRRTEVVGGRNYYLYQVSAG